MEAEGGSVAHKVAFALAFIRRNELAPDDVLNGLEDEIYCHGTKWKKEWMVTIQDKQLFTNWRDKIKKQLGNAVYAKMNDDIEVFSKTTNKLKHTWHNEEHDAFLRYYEKCGKEWQRMTRYIPTRDEAQIRTHAQKYHKKTKSGFEFPAVPYVSWSDKHTNSFEDLEDSDVFNEFVCGMDSVLQTEATGSEEDVSAKMHAAFDAGVTLQAELGQKPFTIDEEQWERWMSSPNGKTVLTKIPLLRIP